MLIRHIPMSNSERQQKFRLGNPGYYARIQARKRAMAKHVAQELRARMLAEAKQARETAAAEQTTAPTAPVCDTQAAPTGC
jgi:hypothetical protein